jgi:hypothetical protein
MQRMRRLRVTVHFHNPANPVTPIVMVYGRVVGNAHQP